MFRPCDPQKRSKVLWIPKEKLFGILQPTQSTVYIKVHSQTACAALGKVRSIRSTVHRCSNACDKDREKEKDKEKDEKEKEEQEKAIDKLLVHILCDSNIAHSHLLILCECSA